MSRITLISSVLWLMILPSAARDLQVDTQAYFRVLQTNVDTEGRVDYQGLKENPRDLDAFLWSAAALPAGIYETWTREEKIAFWLNVYNACTLKVIIDHYPIQSSFFRSLRYPKNSIRQISGVWNKLTFPVMGEPLTLDHIEHEILRREFEEPGIHMALVCAAKSCPPLRREPYTGPRLAEQLHDQAGRFLSSADNFAIDVERRTVYLSSIFKWFREDFIGRFAAAGRIQGLDAGESAVVSFISRFVPETSAAFLSRGDFRLKYLGYDWDLNEGPKR
jgi:hypothetical protein